MPLESSVQEMAQRALYHLNRAYFPQRFSEHARAMHMLDRFFAHADSGRIVCEFCKSKSVEEQS